MISLLTRSNICGQTWSNFKYKIIHNIYIFCMAFCGPCKLVIHDLFYWPMMQMVFMIYDIYKLKYINLYALCFSGPYVFGGSVIIYLLSKEIWVAEHGLMDMIAFCGAIYILHRKIGPGLRDYLNKDIDVSYTNVNISYVSSKSATFSWISIDIFISHGAESPGREILQRPPVCPSVWTSVTFSFRTVTQNHIDVFFWNFVGTCTMSWGCAV